MACGPAQALRQVGAGLGLVVVDGLLAEEHQIGLLRLDHPREQRRDHHRVERAVVADQDGAIRAHGQAARSSAWNLSVPIATATTSPPCRSRSRSASSTAISSKGLSL